MTNLNSRAGLLCALGAFSLWGALPIYFKILGDVSPVEILVHRVIWSSFILGSFMLLSGRKGELVDIIRKPDVVGRLVLSALLIAVNWLVFIWGVSSGRILETSLGYYINPLINVLFGCIFLGERLNGRQVSAISLAAVAVTIQIVFLGKVPWVAFVLAFSFGSYTLVRKLLNINAATGLAVETFVLLPFALGYFVWLVSNDAHAFRPEQPELIGFLMMAGVITTVPLVLFNMATRALNLSVIGVMQYLTPSMSFSIGVLVYGEPMGEVQMVTFGLIWLALAVFTVDGFMRQKKAVRLKRAGSVA